MKLIVITGPTATGKTTLAANVAKRCNGEIISADSRQVYRGMDIGSGKDLEDFVVDGTQIPFHLIDIVDPGHEYNVFQFQKDFKRAFDDVVSRGRQPVLCGGTGLYIEAAIKGYQLAEVPPNPELREELEKLDHQQLIEKLESLKALHNTTDTQSRKRLIRAIEIEMHPGGFTKRIVCPPVPHKVFAINFERALLRKRITQRLTQRLQEGMIEEVEKLLSSGLKPEQLEFYGLEYRFVTQHITGKISKDELFTKLNTAIHQFAKRQMTWFRRMERQGTPIRWIDGNLSLKEKVEIILEHLE
jgi:tRNA dimethylallyltransferase